MKKLYLLIFCLILFSSKGFSQCPNADLSLGSFQYWTGSTGVNSYGNYSSVVAGIVQGATNSAPTDAGSHTIINAPGTDPNTGNNLSVLPPGGTSCARLGNMQSGGEAERLIYPLAVTSSNCIFSYQYAVVLEDPGHSASEQPKFSIRVTDPSGNVFDQTCGIYEVTAGAGIPGFNTSSASDDGETVRWKDWTTVGIDLSLYIGSTVNIEFTTYDCAISQGAHFGYAYLACHCGALQLDQVCSGTSSIVTAPAGYASYSWSTGQTTQTVTYDQSYEGQTVSVICTSVQGCEITLQTIISLDPPVYTITDPPAICEGQSATITTTGSNTYTWSTGTSGSSLTQSPTTTTNYQVTVSSAGGCSSTDEATITVNTIPVANAGNDVTICPSESTTLNASGSSGGSGTLTYAWSNGPTTTTNTVSPSSTTTYTVTVTSNGCTSTDNVVVNVANNLTVAVTPTTSSMCIGSPGIPLTASGATNYSWAPTSGLSPSTGANVTATPSVTTTYIVTGSSGACSGTASVTITVSSVNVSVSPTSTAVCNGSSALLTATGTGTTYAWSPTAGLNPTSGTTVTATPTAQTTYTVTASDAIGCSATASATVDVVTISATATAIDENCGHSNGEATVTPAGNCSIAYGFVWNTNPVQNSATANNLPAGSYTVTVSCGACTTAASATVNNLPGPSVAISNITPATCGYPNGGACAQASGGGGTYTYFWSNGTQGSCITNVLSGTYQVTVYDQDNCSALNSVTISDSPGPSAMITGLDPASCGLTDGSATVTASGGTPGYTYNWSNAMTSATIINVASGTYTVTVTDANSCSTTALANVGEDPGPAVTALSDPENCDQANGVAWATGTGGTGNYTFIWSNGCTTSNCSGLAAGSYSVTISDGGCSAATTVNVMEIQGPDASFSATPKVLTIMDGPVSFLDNSTGDVVNWNWTLGDGNTAAGVAFDHAYESMGIFVVTLIITDDNGCMDTTVDTIKVTDIFTFYIPNAFTPNNDGTNDWFFPQGVSVDPTDFNMYIFDRWGNMMWHTTEWLDNRSAAWNGTMDNSGTYEDVVMDVYVYRIICKEVEGPKHEYIGRIALIP